MMKIERYENGEITFICDCKAQLVIYCREDGIGEVGCENCGRMYSGTSYVDVSKLPERYIPVLKEKVNGLMSEMMDLTIKKGEIEEGLIQVDSALRKARGLLNEEILKQHRKD